MYDFLIQKASVNGNIEISWKEHQLTSSGNKSVVGGTLKRNLLATTKLPVDWWLCIFKAKDTELCKSFDIIVI